MNAPGRHIVKSVVLELFSALMERKDEKQDAIIFMCLAEGSYF